MKKIALIMALVLVFACALVACDNGETNSTPADESSVAGTESTPADESDESVPEENSEESVPGEESDEVSKEPVAAGNVISNGKTYTYPTEGLYLHSSPDWAVSKTAATALTDGVSHADYYGDASMVGWSKVDVEVVIDLGSAQTVTGFKYYAFGGMDGIQLPASVEVFVSNDGENWTPVTTTAGQPVAISSTLEWVEGNLSSVELSAASSAQGQYVKFMFNENGSFVFLSEIEVYGE